jgi:hypothetical protein
MLREVLALFGEGIQESFQRTMSEYLENTNGAKARSKMSDAQHLRDLDLKANNNDAERPFAVMKALKHLYPSIRPCHLSALSLAKVNETHSFEDAGGKHAKTKGRVRSAAGRAWTADPILQKAVAKLCCVRSTSQGRVTILMRQNHTKDLADSAALHKKDHEAKLKEAARLAAVRMGKADAATEVDL